MPRIVEFETRDDARRAIAQLSERQFMGRAVFIREVSYSAYSS
jgi:RNA recognition motif-containing protein